MIHRDIELASDKRTVILHRCAYRDEMRVPRIHTDVIFLAGHLHANSLISLQSQKSGDMLISALQLCAKTSPDFSRNNTDMCCRKSECLGYICANCPSILRGCPDCDLPVGTGLGSACMGFNITGMYEGRGKGMFKNTIRLFEPIVDISNFFFKTGDDVFVRIRTQP